MRFFQQCFRLILQTDFVPPPLIPCACVRPPQVALGDQPLHQTFCVAKVFGATLKRTCRPNLRSSHWLWHTVKDHDALAAATGRDPRLAPDARRRLSPEADSAVCVPGEVELFRPKRMQVSPARAVLLAFWLSCIGSRLQLPSSEGF